MAKGGESGDDDRPAAARAALSLPAEEVAAHLHELEVRQMELETQNAELRQTQAELQKSEARYADLYDFAPVAYFTLDLDGRIRDVNLSATGILGMERGKLLDRRLSTSIATVDRPVLLRHLRRCLEQHERAVDELTLVVRGSASITVQMTSTPLVDPAGAVTGCRTTLADITARKLAEDRLRLLAEASRILGASFECRASIAAVSRLTVPLLGDICAADIEEDDRTLRRLEMAFADPEEEERFESFRLLAPAGHGASPVAYVLRTGRPLLIADCTPVSLGAGAEGFEHELLTRLSGARSVMFVPMIARDRPLGVFTFISTVSDRRFSSADLAAAQDLGFRAGMAIERAHLYEEAQRAIRGRQDMLSFVSHDLKNPLMALLLTTEMLLRHTRSDGESERRRGWHQLERIRQGITQMRRMIEDLLDLSSIEAGKLSTAMAEHDLDSLLKDALDMLAPVAGQKNIQFVLEPREDGDQRERGGEAGDGSPAPGANGEGGGPLRVRCDRARVLQVLSNIVGNAVKFTPEGGRVSLAAAAAGGSALVTVRDNGPGISASARSHLFERFWQGDPLSRTGRGLGLYISRHIVEAHGGSIWVDSQPGAGSAFHFTLPLVRPGAVGSLGTTMKPESGSSGEDPGSYPVIGPG